MATPEWVQDGERWDGANDPNGNLDIMNRANQEIWDMFCVEHDKDGDHFDFQSPAVFESDSYSGNGTDPHNVSLTNSALQIKYLRVWCSTLSTPNDEYWAWCTDTMSADETKTFENVGFVADWIQSIGTGTFQVGGDTGVNDSSETYHYLAIGVE